MNPGRGAIALHIRTDALAGPAGSILWRTCVLHLRFSRILIGALETQQGAKAPRHRDRHRDRHRAKKRRLKKNKKKAEKKKKKINPKKTKTTKM
jgi:hypothetical protein